jgi:glycopeptide antibiotics resistance protein
MVVYVIAVISVTLFPLPIQWSYIVHMIKNKQLGEKNNFIPFHSILDILRKAVAGSVILRQIGGNVLLLSPFGFLLPLLLKNISFKKTFLAGLSFSVVIEGLQYIISAILGFSYRSTDIDDVILNTTGACLGYLALSLILKVFRSNKTKHSNLQSSSVK